MLQDTWEPLNDMRIRPMDKNGIFVFIMPLGKYWLIFSLSVYNGFKSASV